MNLNQWRLLLYRLLTFIGAASAVMIVAQIASSQVSTFGGWRDLLPLPGLYFLEIGGLTVLAALAAWVTTQPQPEWQAGLPWGTAGVLLAFVILGAWTIGLYLIPAFVCFLGAGFADPNLRREKLSARLGMLAGIGLLQGLLIVFMVVVLAA